MTKIFYSTGWDDAAIHFCPHDDSGVWRTVPLDDVPSAPGWKVATLSDAPLGAEFVIRNGEGTQWDNPPPEAGGQNYQTPKLPGSWSLTNGRIMRLAEHEPLLLISDLDNTMVGHDHDHDNARLREFQAQWMGRFAFIGSLLVYSTGRNKADALAVARERGLLRPALLICAVGTEVYEVPQDLPLDSSWADHPGRITLEPQWTQLMVDSFDRNSVEETLRAQFPKFDVKGSPETDPYRIPSRYEVDGVFEEDMAEVRRALGAGVEVITSGGAEWKYVDFCSAKGGKKGGCEFAMSLLKIPPERTLVCGDSGNDESMYRVAGVYGVAVGNSLPELVEQLRLQSAVGPEAVQPSAVFQTKCSGCVLFASEPVASGLVEALDRFWPPA